MSKQQSIITDPRQQRGIEIAATTRIQRQGSVWVVPSQTTASTPGLQPVFTVGQRPPLGAHSASGGHSGNGGTAMALGPSIKDTHAAALDDWWRAGGWKNGAAWLVATGQVNATPAERRDLVKDRLSSATKEALEWADSLPL